MACLRDFTAGVGLTRSDRLSMFRDYVERGDYLNPNGHPKEYGSMAANLGGSFSQINVIQLMHAHYPTIAKTINDRSAARSRVYVNDGRRLNADSTANTDTLPHAPSPCKTPPTP